MPRLLLITAWYAPFIHPRAHRWSALAEYWAAQGIDVHVVCARRRDCPRQARVLGVQVHRVGFDSLREWVYYWFGESRGRGRIHGSIGRPGWPIRFLTWLYQAFWKKIYFPDDAGIWYFPARRRVFQLLDDLPFDAVISVSLPFTGHLIGLAAKRKFPGLRWVADIGDPFTIQARPLNNAWLYGRISERLERNVLEMADASVVTNTDAADAYREKFGPAVYKMAVIPPLLHPPWARPGAGQAPLPPQTGTSVLHIGYFGAFYAPIRTPYAFLELLKKTVERRPDWRGRLQVHLYGDVFPEFWNLLVSQPDIRLYGLRPRQEVRAAMLQMDILLNIGNTTDYQLPSKSVEYFASGKPVVHLSYLPNDPFVKFWDKAPGLCSVQVENGGIGEAEWLRWIAFIDGGWRKIASVGRRPETERFQVESIARAYGNLTGVLQPTLFQPGSAEAPGHR